MKPLSPWGALWNAFWNKESTAYPNENGARIDAKDIPSRIRASLDRTITLAPDKEKMDKARESLAEAKGQTEYQDQKVGRLLTIVSFLTAAAGALFSKITDTYPFDPAHLWTWAGLLTAATYLLFFVFVLFVIAGALVTFHGTRTRFVWESSRGDLSVKSDKKPTSHLFFQECVRTSPENWAESFAPDTTAQMIEAYKGYIVEAYLVNAKIADKLRLLEPAQVMLSHAIRLLMVWLVLTATLFAFVARPPKEDQFAAASSMSSATSLIGGPAKSASAATEPASDPRASIVGQSIVVNCGAAPAPVRAASISISATHVGRCHGSASTASFSASGSSQ